MYSIGLYLFENTDMDIDWGAVVAAVVAIGGIVVTWIKLNVSLAEIKVRQENQDRRIDILEGMVKEQISVDNSIKEILGQIQVGQAAMTEQIKSLMHRLEKHEI